MPRFIVKATPEADFYFEWSTIVDLPTAWGPRSSWDGVEPDRLDRADATGTSSLGNWFDWSETDFYVCNMGDKPFMVDRVNMQAFCESLDPRDADVFDAMLTRAVASDVSAE